ncbi:hypothetical protein CEXT_783501 [Caerostris extrusa]|uniref:Uncharacterized protein n=1 Tax=Caerostris extrusa TaxID=172846 RepID=A0AAV4NA40_CAEEX|nr:hypothetical protein CEXT_783501 [Caerostris extrusa]
MAETLTLEEFFNRISDMLKEFSDAYFSLLTCFFLLKDKIKSEIRSQIKKRPSSFRRIKSLENIAQNPCLPLRVKWNFQIFKCNEKQDFILIKRRVEQYEQRGWEEENLM